MRRLSYRRIRVLAALRRERKRWDRLIREQADVIEAVGVSRQFAEGYTEGIAFAELVIKRNGRVEIRH